VQAGKDQQVASLCVSSIDLQSHPPGRLPPCKRQPMRLLAGLTSALAFSPMVMAQMSP
jgi:hypothetical protein